MLTALLSIFFSFSGLCSNPEPAQAGAIQLRFSHFSGQQKLNPDSLYYNSFGEPYRVSRFKYYITDISLIPANGKAEIAIKESYFLVVDDDDSSKIITVQVPPGNYTGVSFLLGVDSLHNVSGAQTGALDPMNGMFWTWNTGYVIMKLEGKSPLSSLPGNLIEYHLGGFKGPDKADRRIRLNFPKGIERVETGNMKLINVKVDVNALFSGVHSLPIKTQAACTSAGNLARQYAENYATIFSVSSVE